MIEMSYLQILNRICEVVQQKMASNLKDTDEIDWDVHFEILLFYSMLGLKPVGVNRYFMMTAIHQRFTTYINREISSKVIWDHLESLYDMAVLHESEIIPFPNEETDFELPEEFNEMIKEKFGVSLPRPTDENEAPKNSPSLKSVKKLGPSKLKQTMTPVANAKNTFLTPVSVKSAKNYLGSRNESKPLSVENVAKGKQETPFPAKINKVKRSSSPFTAKVTKSETAPDTAEATDALSVKKTNKIENQNSTSAKKTPKNEQNSVNSSSKKSTKKEESNVNSGRQAKSETPDSSSKKVKNEKEHSSKKGKVTPAENSAPKKSLKTDGKKNESENNHKKSSETPANKTKSEKITNKSLKYDEVESPPPSGSRKSGKIDTSDKKKKRQKIEEPSKKLTPAAKRRRT